MKKSLIHVLTVLCVSLSAAFTAVADTIDLNATGAMGAKPQVWSNPENITAQDTNYATTGTDLDKLYTEFDDSADLGVINSVVVRVRSAGDTVVDDMVAVNFTNDSGTTWSKADASWLGTEADNLGAIVMPSAMAFGQGDITVLNGGVWTWADINALGMLLRPMAVNTQDFTVFSVDYVYLRVNYTPYSPTPTITETVDTSLTSTITETVTETSTETLTVTETNSATLTETGTETETVTGTMTDTVTETITGTATETVTGTHSQTITETATETLQLTLTDTETVTQTMTDTVTVTVTPTETGSVTPTNTSTITDTMTSTVTGSATPTVTQTQTETTVFTGTDTPTVTQTLTDTPEFTATDTETSTPTMSNTQTGTETITSTVTSTATETVTATDTQTVTPTVTETDTKTVTSTVTETLTVTDTPQGTLTDTQTITPTGTDTITGTVTQTTTQSNTATVTQTVTQTTQNTQTDTPTVTGTVTATVTATGTQTVTQTMTGTSTPSVTQTITQTDTKTITETVTQTVTKTDTSTVTRTITQTNTRTITETVTPSATRTSTRTITETVTQTDTRTITETATFSPTVTVTSTIVIGDGTASVSPSSVVKSSSGNTMIIDYYAGSTSFSTGGYIKVTIPAGWSAPSLTSGQPGYYTVSVSNGTFSGTSRSGQVITVFCNALTAGSGRIRITYGSGAPGATAQASTGLAYFGILSAPAGGAGNDIASSPYVDVVNPSPTVTQTATQTVTPTITLTATGTPTVTVTSTPLTGEGSAVISPLAGVTSGSGNTYIITYTAGITAWANSPSYGTFKLFIPAGFSPPSETSSAPGYFTYSVSSGSVSGYLISGQEIRLYVQGLNAGGNITLIYGSKASGGPGAVNASSAGSYDFRIETATSGTTVNNIALQPVLLLAQATQTATATVTMTSTATPVSTPAAVSGLNAILIGDSFTMIWNNTSGNDFYRIYNAAGVNARQNQFPSGWNLVATVMPTPGINSFTRTDLNDHSFYMVSAVNGAGEGKPSGAAGKVNLSFLYTPGSTNTYRISVPYSDKYPKALDIVAAIEGNTYTASKIDTIGTWNPQTQSFQAFMYKFGAWSFGTNFNVDAGTSSSNALYIHVISPFIWKQAVLDTDMSLVFHYNNLIANANKRMLPYSMNYTKASDIVRDIEGGLGAGRNLKISKIAKWNPASQSYTAFGYSEGISQWGIGTDFDVFSGDALNIYLSGNTQDFTWSPKAVHTPVP